MTWDAVAALCVVAAAVVLLVWRSRAETRVCAKCDVVASKKRVNGRMITRKPASELGIGK